MQIIYTTSNERDIFFRTVVPAVDETDIEIIAYHTITNWDMREPETHASLSKHVEAKIIVQVTTKKKIQ